MKILGLDIGQKRIGLALSDGKICSPYGLIEIAELFKAVSEVSQIIRKENVEKIIIGIPKNQNSLQADIIHKFAIELAKIINLPIEYVDESLTTKEAERLMTDSGQDEKSEKYKQEIDKLSAKLILEQYLSK